MDYEERIKYRDNEFLYEKCCKQYNVLMEYQHKMRDYKQQIETLEEENKKLKEKVVELSNHLSLYSSEETLLNRIDKAIEYIEQHLFKWYDTNGIEHIEPRELEDNTDAGFLLKILKGEE